MLNLLQYTTPWHLSSLIFYSFLVIFCTDNRYSDWYIQWTAYILSLVTFLFSISLFWNFMEHCVYSQSSVYFYFSENLNLLSKLSIDGISIFFVLLTTIITPISLLTNWTICHRVRELILCIFSIEFFLIVAFTVDDFLIFFAAFESVLIPMFLMIGIWGSRPHKSRAAYWFFLYTLAGSVFFLYAIIILYFSYGTTNLSEIIVFIKHGYCLDIYIAKQLWVCLFIAFAVKIPVFPFHVWLPEAHVEAPTSGSIILASLLLKLGGYGIIRFILSLFPAISIYFTPFVFTVCSIGMFYTTLTAIRQVDLKRLIAYSSVAHMNYIVLGIFSCGVYGIIGSMAMMISHGIVSTGLFFMVGVLYERHGVRFINYYSGLVLVMPLFSVFFAVFIFSNSGFPMLSNFVGEMLVFTSIVGHDAFLSLIVLPSIYFSGVYSVWVLNRILFGSINLYCSSYTLLFKSIGLYSDLNKREFCILFFLFITNVIIGIFPNSILLFIIDSIYLLSYSW